MTRTTTGHPTRAFAGLLTLLLGWFVARAPDIGAHFIATLQTVRALRAATSRTTTLRATVARSAARPRRATSVTSIVAPISAPAVGAAPIIGVEQPIIRLRSAAPLRDDADPTAPATFAHVATLYTATIDPIVLHSPLSPAGETFAAAAYKSLAAGNRRAGARLLVAATVIGGDPRVLSWTQDRDALSRRWSGSAYVIARRTGDTILAGTPVLGGGQTGAAITYTPDPLARRPLSVTLRDFAALRGGGLDADTRQAAIGINWRIVPALTLSAERMIPLGRSTTSAWSLRAAGGAATRWRGIDVAAYAEAGLVGRATYAAAQARADVPVAIGRVAVHAGAGAWASVQHDGRRIGRLDAGPGVRLGVVGIPVEVSVDYRFRLDGNAAPGRGPVVTLSATF